MDSFEQAFSDTERAATSTLQSAAGLVSLAKQLQKAAKEGNIAAIKRVQKSVSHKPPSCGVGEAVSS